MNKTITVRGKGSVKIKPDTIEIYLTLKNTKKTYDNALLAYTEDMHEIEEIFEKMYLSKSYLNSKNFQIRPEYKSARDENGLSIQKLVGYSYSVTLTYDLPIHKNELGDILYNISCCKCNVNLSVNYKVKCEETLKNEALENAINEASYKAKIISETSKIKLGNIINIEYATNENHYIRNNIDLALSSRTVYSMNNPVDFSINPEDITIEDEVVMTWEII